MPNEIILLSRSDIESLMPFGEYVDAVAEAFRLHAEGRAVSARRFTSRRKAGAFMSSRRACRSGGAMWRSRPTRIFRRTAVCGTCPPSRAQSCCWTRTTNALAFLDSMEITLKRTGAATAVASRYLARPDSNRDDLRLRRAGPHSARCASPRPRHRAGIRMGQGRRRRCRICGRDVQATRHRCSDGVEPARGHPGERRHRDMHPVA